MFRRGDVCQACCMFCGTGALRWPAPSPVTCDDIAEMWPQPGPSYVPYNRTDGEKCYVEPEYQPPHISRASEFGFKEEGGQNLHREKGLCRFSSRLGGMGAAIGYALARKVEGRFRRALGVPHGA